MKSIFDNYLKNDLSKYDLKYLSSYKYVMLLSKNGIIHAFFANLDYIYFIEYPNSLNEYHTPLDVLKSEIELTKSESGIIYENFDGYFKSIAFIDLQN